jgi:hypothetical protein
VCNRDDLAVARLSGGYVATDHREDKEQARQVKHAFFRKDMTSF